MRVLHLYAGNLFGGIERVLLTLWRARRCAPHLLPHFALCFDARLARELRADGAPVDVLGDVRLSRPWTVIRSRRRLVNLLARERFDVALAHSLWPHLVFAPAVRDAGVPLVTWLHDVPRAEGWLEWLAQREPPDLWLANSHYTAWRAAGAFPGARIEVQYPPVELPHAPRETTEPRQDSFVILVAARLQMSKGHEILIDALSLLREGIDWRCRIAGEPQRASERAYLDELRRHAQRLGVQDRVSFLGHRDDAARLVEQADVLCQPNTEPEGFGLAFAEALAVGTPVITTALGAACELIDGASGVLVPPHDARAVAAAIESLARERHDNSSIYKSIRAARVAGGRERVRQMCAAEWVMPRLARVLERVGARS